MKDHNSDSTAVLERFARDKRKRTTTAERVERRPRPRRDADDNNGHEAPRRASFNPHFTADNRLIDERPRRAGLFRHDEDHGEGRPSGRAERYGDHKGGYGAGRDDARGGYGKRPYGARHHGEGHSAGNRYQQDRTGGYDADREEGAERPGYGKRPYGTQQRYGDKPAYGKRSGGHPSPKRNYGETGGKEGFRRDERGGAPKRYGAKSAGGYRQEGDRPRNYPRYNPNAQTGEMRLNRFIAQSGLCSRREADDYILAGVVSVNGVVVTELGTKVKPTDEVRFNDSRIQGEKKVYLVLNKPKGYVTSLEDPHADKTVMELVKGACDERIYPVGRLDKNSLGLLLFTNDGDLTRQLTHPSYMKKKIYQVSLDKPLTRADMDRIVEGITLEDGEIHADEIAYVSEEKNEVGIEIHSGRNRIVRRIFESLGYVVRKLDRVYYAGLTKKNLKRGAWRFLTREEVTRLKSGQYE